MFLKSITLNGFKSFCNTTKVNFVDGLTVIVGPNGSGKSNINDAIKWVFGEQSKKELRTTTSDEIIFAGSEKEKASDFVEVSLIFDNKNKILNIDFEEVEITRRAYRGEELSEYFINKSVVRRKDVRNLFLDTGLGNIDLAVISQGSVSKITEAKPEELRELLNEAAGVARYQSQKDEASRKLERVSQNLEIFEVKLDDLDKQIKPLEKQRVKAEKYLKYKEELSHIELPLLSRNLQNNIKRKSALEEEISTKTKQKDFTSEKIEITSQTIINTQEKILQYEEELYKLQLKQNELSQKFQSKLSFKNQKEEITFLIQQHDSSIHEVEKLIKENAENVSSYESNISSLRDSIMIKDAEKEKLQILINKLEYEVTSLQNYDYNTLDRATKAIIDNKDAFDSIHGIVKDVISYDSKYEVAINVSIKSSLRNILVSTDRTAKQAINFLKENRLGVATFIPERDVVPKHIIEEIYNVVRNQSGFIGVLSDLIKTDKKFVNAISSIAGNILVYDTFDNAIATSKLINHKLKIVTLDGDILFPGLTIRGGFNQVQNSQINIELKQKEIERTRKLLQEIIVSKNGVDMQYQSAIKLHQESEKEKARLHERLEFLKQNLTNSLGIYKDNFTQEFDLSQLKTDSDYISNDSIENLNNKIKSIHEIKMQHSKDLISSQKEEDLFRKNWQKLLEEITDAKITLDKLNSKIDNDMLILSRDYKITYESLLEKGNLELPNSNLDEVEKQVINIREAIAELGFINIEAIEEYDRIFKDYSSLKVNTLDLRETKAKLITTIASLDKEVIVKFEKTFDQVNEQLTKVFNVLFRGGQAKLIYSNKEDILNSGIEFNGQTPGKIVQNIKLYSGGEKSLMALSLIFAINEVKKLPLLILDEVEAALDEANVDRFAKFAKEVNKRDTQILITTHRPGTMEMADVLYGVTMQQKGISKIVSVKLEEAIEMAQ